LARKRQSTDSTGAELARLYPKKQPCDGWAAHFRRPEPWRAPALPGPFGIRLRIIAACVIPAVAGADHLTYLVDASNSLRGLLIAQQQEVTAMKLSIVAVAAVLALSSPAFAQSSSDGLNGSTLGKSMPGVNNGVPYPNTNVTNGTAPVGSSGWTRHHKHYRHDRHHRHYKHHRHSGM
jgi:hypothetical protein